MVDHVFPEQTDANDAANFAQYHGQANLLDYVESGLDLTADFAVPEVTISTGKAYISADSMFADNESTTRENTVGLTVELDQRTVGLTDSTTNYVYVDANIDTTDTGASPDTPQIITNTSGSNPTEESLLIGVVDTSANTVEQRSREPTGTFGSLEVVDSFSASRSTTSVSSNYTTDGEEAIFVDTSAGSITVTLSDADTEQGRSVTIIDVGGNARVDPITVTTESGQTIDGKSSITSGTVYGSTLVFSDGTDWYTAGQEYGNLQRFDSYIRTATGGSVPAVDTTFQVNLNDLTQPIEVLVTAATQSPGFAYEYNYEYSIGYDGSTPTVGVTVTWDDDPGAGNDLDLQIDIYTG